MTGAGLMTWWLARDEGRLPAGAGWLSPAERSRAGQMRYAKRRTDFLLSRWTLKLAVARAFGWPDDEPGLARIEARPAPGGAPRLYADGEPMAAGGVAQRPGGLCRLPGGRALRRRPGGSLPAAVGCDIEIVEPRSAAFVRDYLTAPERLLSRRQAQPGTGRPTWSGRPRRAR